MTDQVSPPSCPQSLSEGELPFPKFPSCHSFIRQVLATAPTVCCFSRCWEHGKAQGRPSPGSTLNGNTANEPTWREGWITPTGAERSPDPHPRLLCLMPVAHSDQRNLSLDISNVRVSQVTRICGPGQGSVAQRGRGWRGGFGEGQEGLLEKVTFKQGTEDRGRERLAAEYSGRARAEGKLGTSRAFPENGKAAYPEQSEPRGRGRSGGRGGRLATLAPRRTQGF